MTQPIYYINSYDALDQGNVFASLQDAFAAATAKYYPESRIYIYKSSDDQGEGSVEVAWRGDVRNIPSELDSYIMDASTANLGDRG